MPRDGGGEMSGAAQSRETVLDALFRQHRDAAMACAMSILRDRSLAEDAVQQAFTQIAVSLGRGDVGLVEANPRALVVRNARWAAIRIAQRRRATPTLDDEAVDDLSGGDAGEDWQRAEARILCSTILGALPQHYRQALVLRHVDQEADNSAAAHLGVTVKAYRERLRRAVVMARGVCRTAGIAAIVESLLVALRRLRHAPAHAVATARHSLGAALARLGGPLVEAANLQALPFLAVGAAVALTQLTVAAPAATSAAVAMRPAAATPSHRAGDGADVRVAGNGSAPAADSPSRSVGSTPGPGATQHQHPIQLLNPPADARSETPDDTGIHTATPSPDFQHDHTLLATGYGLLCGCNVIFQSHDGGLTWAAAAGPPTGVTQIVLPPAYPRDSRIFLSSPAESGSADYVAASFGAPFVPLPVPPGALALSPQFDNGDPHLLVAGSAGLWSYDVDTGVAVPMLPDGRVVRASSVATAAGPDGAILAIGEDVAQAGTALAGAGGSGENVMYACRATGCTLVSHPPVLGVLQVSPVYASDHTVLIDTDSQPAMVASHDGGATWTSLALPSSISSVNSASILLDVDGRAGIWACGTTGDGRLMALLQLTPTGWRTLLAVPPPGPGTAVAATADHIVAVRTGTGILFAPRH